VSETIAAPLSSLSINKTENLQVTKISFNEYDRVVKTAPGANAPTESRKLRDYVVTIKNNSSKQVLAYRFAFSDPTHPNDTQATVSFPIYSTDGFAPGAEITKRVLAVPANYQLQISAAVFSGLVGDGDKAAVGELLTRIKACNDKIAAVAQRIEAIAKLPDAVAAAQSLAGESSDERARLEQAQKEQQSQTDWDTFFHIWGAMEGLSIARPYVAQIANSDNSETRCRSRSRADQYTIGKSRR
jgi:hypothetical protein